MSFLTVLLVVALAVACKPGEAQPALRVGRYAGSAVAPLTAFETSVINAMTRGKYTVTTVTLASAQERLDCLTGGTTKFPTPGCDAVISRFTVTDARKLLVTFLAPYYYGDGAGLKARTQAIANQVVVSTDARTAYSNYINFENTVCIQAGSAYIPGATALGFTLVTKPDIASILADPNCDLLITDSVAEQPPYITVKGPVIPNTAAPWGVAVQLKKAGQTAAQKAIRANLHESATAIYQGVPGTTPLEKLDATLVTKGITAASAAIKNGANFINKFFY